MTNNCGEPVCDPELVGAGVGGGRPPAGPATTGVVIDGVVIDGVVTEGVVTLGAEKVGMVVVDRTVVDVLGTSVGVAANATPHSSDARMIAPIAALTPSRRQLEPASHR